MIPVNLRELLFAATIVVCSFLLFVVEPLAGKALLPPFGGSAAVWSACLLFFQLVLLAGYAWSHLLQRLPVRGQFVVQAVAVSLAIALQNGSALVTAGSELAGGAGGPATGAGGPIDTPVMVILGRLLATIGMPYLVLSSVSPLLQAWSTLGGGRNPYRLYALSNVASLVALLSYPLLLEPALGLSALLQMWATGINTAGVLLLCCIAVSWQAATTAPVGAVSSAKAACADEASARPAGDSPLAAELATATAVLAGTRADLSLAAFGITWRTWVLWLVGSAGGSVLLLAFTNHICRDLAPVPFLWVLPLALYLLTFVLVFADPPWYRTRPTALAVLGLGALQVLPWLGGERASALVSVNLNLATFFVMTWFLHGEVGRRRPPPIGLTGFYLMLSVGGALGGVLVNFVAPAVFSDYWELPLAEAVVAIVAARVLLRDPESVWHPRPGARAPLLPVALATMIVMFSLVPPFMPGGELWFRQRNFYGVVRVSADADRVVLTHGRVEHGNRALAPAQAILPTAYYGPNSAVDAVFRLLAPRGPLTVGAVGMGVGTIAAYGRSGDRFTFFELNPAVVEAAMKYFVFISSSAAQVEIVVGDGRRALEQRSASAPFDLLVLDAFSSDAIPTHLLTREAFKVYRRHLRADGILLVHISNNHLDLGPLMAGLAADNGWRLVLTDSLATEKNCLRSLYAILLPVSFRHAVVPPPAAIFQAVDLEAKGLRRLLWTDDASDLLSVLR